MAAPLKLNIERAGAEFGELVELSNRLGFDLSSVLDGLLDSATPVFGVDVDPGVAATADDGVFAYKLADRLYGVLAALRAWDHERDLCQISISHSGPPEIEITPEMIEVGARMIADAIDIGRGIAYLFVEEIFISMIRAGGDAWRYPPRRV